MINLANPCICNNIIREASIPQGGKLELGSYYENLLPRMWCHEWFNLSSPPDIVTFSKKMQTGGLYHKADLRPRHAYRIFNTWVGDPGKVCRWLAKWVQNVCSNHSWFQWFRQWTMEIIRLNYYNGHLVHYSNSNKEFQKANFLQIVLLGAILKAIKQDKLLENTLATGEVLMKGKYVGNVQSLALEVFLNFFNNKK